MAVLKQTMLFELKRQPVANILLLKEACMHAAWSSFGHEDQPPVGQTTWEYYNIYIIIESSIATLIQIDVFHSSIRAARVYLRIREPVSLKATFTPNPGLW